MGSNECVSIYHIDQEREARHSPKSLRFGYLIGREQLAHTPLYFNSCPGTGSADCWRSIPIPSSRNGSPSPESSCEDIHQHFGDGRRRRRIPGYMSALFKACIFFLTTVQSDEVESLTAARAGAVDGREPSDALRVCDRASCIYIFTPCEVVNALLTQLDKLKHRKNVLIMSTSNLPSAIRQVTYFATLLSSFADLDHRPSLP